MSGAGKQREDWFVVGRPLSGGRGALLMALSFILPIALWCFAAYAPFLWKVDYKISLTADPSDRDQFPATYVPGDTLEEALFLQFQEAVRSDNEALAAQQAAGTPSDISERSARRLNQKIMKGFEPVMRSNGWFTREQDDENVGAYFEEYFSEVFKIWEELAAGALTPEEGTMSGENLEVVRKNWAMLSAVSPVYDPANFLSEPMYRLVPEGEKVVGRPAYLPAPDEVLRRAFEDFGGDSELGALNIWEKYRSSLKVVFVGFLLAVAIGVPLALMAGTLSFFARLFEPFIDFFRYMPAPAFGTVLMAIFGVEQQPKIALVFLGTFPHLILMVANTTRLLDQSLLEAAQTLGAKRGQLVWRVVVPGLMPSLYNDLRILLGWAWTWLVVAELIGTKSGLTEIIDTQGRRFHFDHVYPVILLIGMTGFITDQILSGIRGAIFPWTSEGRQGVVGRGAMMVIRGMKWMVDPGRVPPEVAVLSSNAAGKGEETT